MRMKVQHLKKILTVIILLLGLGCDIKSKKQVDTWKPIKIGDYLFDFPSDFKLAKETGIDSYVGKIEGDSLAFEFDFGFYSNHLTQTPEEYLKNEFWKSDIESKFMKNNVVYDNKSMPKIEILTIKPAKTDSLLGKECDYIVHYKHDNKTYYHPIALPEDIKKQNIIIDTIGNVYRKIVSPNDRGNGIVGIYLAELNGRQALSISTSNLTIEQQYIALKILKTGRLDKTK
jgi:hypothetical protein